MRNQYRIDIEREFERLWINKSDVFVLDKGKDKFTVTDGVRSISAKGPILLRVMKKLHDKARTFKMWEALFAAEEIRSKHKGLSKITITTP